MNILLIEDDTKTAQALSKGLRQEGNRITICHNGNDGLHQLTQPVWDLIILDWMLPGMDGIHLLKCIQKLKIRIPTLLLTARDTVEDRVLGLDSGADDYLVKPFAFAELLARIRALARRSALPAGIEIRISDLYIDLVARRAWRAGGEIFLTPREFDLLVCLARFREQTVSRKMLVQDVWRECNRFSSLDNVIDVHVARLRKKVDGESNHRLIHTVRGIGYVVREGRDS